MEKMKSAALKLAAGIFMESTVKSFLLSGEPKWHSSDVKSAAALTHEWRFTAPLTLGRVSQIEQTFEGCWDTFVHARTCSRTLDFWNIIQG